MALTPGFEPGPHRWEASALLTAPSPAYIQSQPKKAIILVTFVFFHCTVQGQCITTNLFTGVKIVYIFFCFKL